MQGEIDGSLPVLIPDDFQFRNHHRKAEFVMRYCVKRSPSHKS